MNVVPYTLLVVFFVWAECTGPFRVMQIFAFSRIRFGQWTTDIARRPTLTHHDKVGSDASVKNGGKRQGKGEPNKSRRQEETAVSCLSPTEGSGKQQGPEGRYGETKTQRNETVATKRPCTCSTLNRGIFSLTLKLFKGSRPSYYESPRTTSHEHHGTWDPSGNFHQPQPATTSYQMLNAEGLEGRDLWLDRDADTSGMHLAVHMNPNILPLPPGSATSGVEPVVLSDIVQARSTHLPTHFTLQRYAHGHLVRLRLRDV